MKSYHDPIVNSFTYAKIENLSEDALRRLSNGPLESFNNIPSALRTQSHGISNFEYVRNRILWAIRDDAPIKADPYTREQVHTDGKKNADHIIKIESKQQ